MCEANSCDEVYSHRSHKVVMGDHGDVDDVSSLDITRRRVWVKGSFFSHLPSKLQVAIDGLTFSNFA